MLTANAMPEHIADAEAAGADLHLGKPFTAQALFDAIGERHLDRATRGSGTGGIRASWLGRLAMVSTRANTSMALTIYGSPRSRTLRVLWIAAELEA